MLPANADFQPGESDSMCLCSFFYELDERDDAHLAMLPANADFQPGESDSMCLCSFFYELDERDDAHEAAARHSLFDFSPMTAPAKVLKILMLNRGSAQPVHVHCG